MGGARELSPVRLVTRYEDQTISADPRWARRCPTGKIFEKLQSTRLPVGGQVSFRLKANGFGENAARREGGHFESWTSGIGQVIVGSFDGKLTSDGLTAQPGIELRHDHG